MPSPPKGPPYNWGLPSLSPPDPPLELNYGPDPNLWFKSTPADMPEVQKWPRVRGVLINCDGDMERHQMPRFVGMLVDYNDHIFNTPFLHMMPPDLEELNCAPQISSLAGSALLMRRYGNARANTQEKAESPTRSRRYNANRPAKMLNLSLNPGFNFGTFSRGWGFEVDPGTVLVVRKDHKDLLPCHVEVLDYMCGYDILNLAMHSDKDESIEAMEAKDQKRRAGLEELVGDHGDNFKRYYQRYMMRKLGPEGWMTVPPPWVM
ncbi:uncharacterized protein KY384_003406 [Bacidia gigantensis]|uniref:uncharacterized protein n=1 Tax=Bacidia gigantensis TaxID=2732470 RepID=UPI001D03F6FB|nr:uncharacterized protein KY384_003406 [Bacidia gigantensis]KAG8531770.1 hypothetical protein KY384_003406 [Bacidia gigantensis]